MRRVVMLLCLTIVLLVGAAHLYRDPRVRELFLSAPVVGHGLKSRITPAAPAKPRKPAPERATQPAAIPRQHEPDLEPEDRPQNMTSNQTTSRVLLRILAAKGLASGLSLEVSDGAIRVMGEVESAEKRSAILAIIEKARETRQVDASGLIALK